MEIVKVQQTKSNTFINLPREIRESLNLLKGDKVLLRVEDGKVILEKC